MTLREFVHFAHIYHHHFARTHHRVQFLRGHFPVRGALAKSEDHSITLSFSVPADSWCRQRGSQHYRLLIL